MVFSLILYNLEADGLLHVLRIIKTTKKLRKHHFYSVFGIYK
ncbi:hypothetical protein LX77_00240 [Gelidibacter algens]|uniref:Uncharacterized protein n=1 Tax=Gelidibacter algens TaxID=49280 RepID=A0A327SF71_9FLAO|nr:hypothetical protein LX77_00240 [Gelidibacter algens]